MLLVFCFGNNICKSQVVMTLVHLIELVQATSMVPIEPDLVDKAVADFFASVKASDWEDLAHSKFHWLCHFACHQKKLTFLPSCWCHERKHKQAKKFCSQTYNTHGYEFGILKELCSQDLHNLQKEDVFATHARLQQRGAASKSGSSYRTTYPSLNCIPAVWHAWSQLALQRKVMLSCMVQ